MEKETFCFKKSWRDAMVGLPEQVKLEVYEAVIEYALTGRLVELKAIARAAFGFIKLDIDNSGGEGTRGEGAEGTDNVSAYTTDAGEGADGDPGEGAEGTRGEGAEGTDNVSAYTTDAGEGAEGDQGAPRARVNGNNKKIREDIKNNNQKIEKETQKKENEKSEEYAGEVDVRAFVEYFNREMEAGKAVIPHNCLPTQKRMTSVRARCREHGKASLATMVQKAVASAFLNGCNNKGWVASLDWLLRPNNFVKVVEGNYDNDKTSSMNYKNQDYGNNRQNINDRRRAAEAVEHTPDEYEEGV